jgi:threonine dehydrogenase-like Zn-dependent dehydrogenase
MKRVFALGGKAVLRDVPEPEIRPGEVLVAPAFSAISAGTEMYFIRGSGMPGFTMQEYPGEPPSWPKVRTAIRSDHPFPRPSHGEALSIGYSVAGRVLAVGADILDIKPGDRVACSGSQCAHHAERVAVPRNLISRVPDDVPLEDAAFVTLGTIALGSLRESDCRFGETVVVYGLGLLGLLVGQIAISAGMRVIGLDLDPARLDLARTLGIEHVFDPTTVDAVEVVHGLTDGFGADAVVLGAVTPSSEPLNQSFDLCRQRGRVVALGQFGWTIDRARMFANEVTVVPVKPYGPGRYDPVYEEGNVDYPIGYVRWTEIRIPALFLDLLAAGTVRVAPLAPVLVPIERAPEAFELVLSEGRPPSVVLSYPDA